MGSSELFKYSGLLGSKIILAFSGKMPASIQFVVSVCQSLQQVALQCQQDTQSYWYIHQAVVPCLLGLAVQAAVQGKAWGWGTDLFLPGSSQCL